MKPVRTLFSVLGYAAMAIFVVLLAGLSFLSVPASGWKALSVQTGSMRPVIEPGALVLVHRVPASDLRVGDVITYSSPEHKGITITHRITHIDDMVSSLRRITTKGDANASTDKPILSSDVLGRVETHVAGLGHITDWIRTPLGIGLVILLPSLIIILHELRILVRRLTAIEVEKKSQQPSRPTPEAPLPAAGLKEPAPLPVSATPPATPSARPAQRPVRRLDGLGAFLAIMLVASLAIHTTFAWLPSSVTLSPNTISGSPSGGSGGGSGKIVLSKLDLRCSGLNLIDANRTPRITLYNMSTMPKERIRIGGWKLYDNSGQVVASVPAGLILLSGHHISLLPWLSPARALQYAGDRLVLKDTAGVTVDSLSWGTDTTAFSPSIAGVMRGVRINRTAAVDTDTAADWTVDTSRHCLQRGIPAVEQTETADTSRHEPASEGQSGIEEE